MARVNPQGSQQQQTLTRVMPLLFGVWGFLFPAGLVVYWTTSNLWQIGQQHFVLRARQREEQAIAEGRKAPPEPKKRSGLMSGLMERAQQQREGKGTPPTAGSGRSGASGKSGAKPSGGSYKSGGTSKAGGTSKTGGGSSKSSGSRTSSGSGRPAPPDPDRPRSYRPAATSGDGRGRTAPRGTRSPYGVAAEDGSVNSGDGGAGGGATSGGSSGTGNRQGGQRSSGGRSNAGSRRKRRKR
jgi:YidC/Oxa1 family membrane protein insertase